MTEKHLFHGGSEANIFDRYNRHHLPTDDWTNCSINALDIAYKFAKTDDSGMALIVYSYTVSPKKHFIKSSIQKACLFCPTNFTNEYSLDTPLIGDEMRQKIKKYNQAQLNEFVDLFMNKAHIEGLKFRNYYEMLFDSAKEGEAYGFFDFGTINPAKKITKAEMPSIVQRSGARGLEASLMEVKDLPNKVSNQDLFQTMLANEVHPTVPSGYVGDEKPRKMVNLKYVIKATAKLENEKVADELGMVINEIYQTYVDRDIFYTTITWKENGEYLLSA